MLLDHVFASVCLLVVYISRIVYKKVYILLRLMAYQGTMEHIHDDDAIAYQLLHDL